VVFRIKGVWSGLTWGCALAGRPAVHVAFADEYDLAKETSQAYQVHFSDLVEIVSKPLFEYQIIQLHAVSFYTGGAIKRVGDPLYQDKIFPLVTHLLEQIDHQVVIHVNNRTDISMLDPRVNTVLCPEPPSTGLERDNYWGNLDHLSEEDEVLFRIKTDQDFEWMISNIHRWKLSDRFTVHMMGDGNKQRNQQWARELIERSLGVHLLMPVPFVTIPMSHYSRKDPNK